MKRMIFCGPLRKLNASMQHTIMRLEQDILDLRAENGRLKREVVALKGGGHEIKTDPALDFSVGVLDMPG